jgi:hypothetical protein
MRLAVERYVALKDAHQRQAHALEVYAAGAPTASAGGG